MLSSVNPGGDKSSPALEPRQQLYHQNGALPVLRCQPLAPARSDTYTDPQGDPMSLGATEETQVTTTSPCPP